MYTIDQIRHVHLEISSRCNAACPLCPRNLYGYPYNDGYVEHNMTLDQAQIILQPGFVAQLDRLLINGNFGDAVMNPHTVPIIKYFRKCNAALEISMSTNGAARDQQYWQDLAQLDVTMMFCIDGLEDTHHLYRQNTVYQTVIQNAKIFMAAGGRAVWKMIRFEHNQHQIPQAQELSKTLGFREFRLVDQSRDQGPVFDQRGRLVHVMKQPEVTDFTTVFEQRTQGHAENASVTNHVPIRPIDCEALKQRSIYVSSTGDVYPCCYMGFSPRTFGHGHSYHAVINRQFRHLVQENNAIEHDLQHCISWFDHVQRSWDLATFEQGRMIVCNHVCGKASDSHK